MNYRMTDPFQALTGLQRALAATKPRRSTGVEPTSSVAFPPINFFRQDENYMLVAELPGVDKEGLNVEVHKNQVRLAGTKAIKYEPDQSVHRRERPGGRFDRSFELPIEVDVDKVEASLQNGMLTMKLPPAANSRPRAIRVG